MYAYGMTNAAIPASYTSPAGHTISIDYVAGGMFTQVVAVKASGERKVYTEQFSVKALTQYNRIVKAWSE